MGASFLEAGRVLYGKKPTALLTELIVMRELERMIGKRLDHINFTADHSSDTLRIDAVLEGGDGRQHWCDITVRQATLSMSLEEFSRRYLVDVARDLRQLAAGNRWMFVCL